VRTRAQAAADASDWSEETFALRPLGDPAQYARRVAAEADAAAAEGDSSQLSTLLTAAVEAAVESGAKPYEAGELAASKLKPSQFLLLRVGPFADVWDTVAHARLASGEETAALVAAERATGLNAGWDCCFYLQAQLMEKLGRKEEQRDLALSALEAPFWTLGAPLREVMAAAQLSHVDDLRSLVRAMEDQVREQQNAPPRTPSELASLTALGALDTVVRTRGSWDDARGPVASALREAGLDEAARVAEGQLAE
jgi:hypothetical protein